MFKHLVVRGGPYERGVQYGQQAASMVARSREAYEAVFADATGWSWAQVCDQARLFVEPMERFEPRFVDGVLARHRGRRRPRGHRCFCDERSDRGHVRGGCTRGGRDRPHRKVGNARVHLVRADGRTSGRWEDADWPDVGLAPPCG